MGRLSTNSVRGFDDRGNGRERVFSRVCIFRSQQQDGVNVGAGFYTEQNGVWCGGLRQKKKGKVFSRVWGAGVHDRHSGGSAGVRGAFSYI